MPVEGLGSGASRSTLTKAGIVYAHNIVLPAAGRVASKQADDKTCWVVPEILTQDDAAIFCEVYFPCSKLSLLEAIIMLCAS